MKTITYNELIAQTVDGIYNLLEYTSYPKEKGEIKSIIEKKFDEFLESAILFNGGYFTVWEEDVKIHLKIKEGGQIQVFKYLNYEKTMIIDDVILDCLTSSYQAKKELAYSKINPDNWIDLIAYRNMLLEEHACFKIKNINASGHTLFNVDPDTLTEKIIIPFFKQGRGKDKILNFFKPQYFGKVRAMMEVMHGIKLIDSFGKYLEAPAIGTEYYRISLADNVYTASFQNSYLEMKQLENGNMFDTKENALSYIKYKKAKRRLVKRMTEFNNLWDRTYEETLQKYGIDYNPYTREFRSFPFSNPCSDLLAFKSEGAAQKLIDEMEDDLRIYFRF